MSKKRDLEFICNIEWKNKPENVGDKANILGMYDIPSTTLSWDIFKSYLLKNSGIAGDDVIVSYQAAYGNEILIRNQFDFQIALYVFRKKARNGEIINLKLDRVSDQFVSKKQMQSNDVETQIDADDISIAHSSICNVNEPPQWFLNHLAQFKEEIVKEVTSVIGNTLTSANLKSHTASQPLHHRKCKGECLKRSRKHTLSLLGDVPNEKDIAKSLKLERKLENKLEKLESKTKKMKEKKMALFTKSSDSDASHAGLKGITRTKEKYEIDEWNAAPVKEFPTIVPHMVGGEVYMHKWEVINNGSRSWTSQTNLQYTWGTVGLRPIEKVVPVPLLKPGERGTISVLLGIPQIPKRYECYWYFYHEGRRFGHWLGFQVIVDPVNHGELQAQAFTKHYESLRSKYLVPKFETELPYLRANVKSEKPEQNLSNEPLVVSKVLPLDNDKFNELKKAADDVTALAEKLNIDDVDVSSDSDNQSVTSGPDNDCYKLCEHSDEFILVPMPPTLDLKIEDSTVRAPSKEASVLQLPIQSASEHYTHNIDNVKIPNNVQPQASNTTAPAEDSSDKAEHEAVQESDDNNNNTGAAFTSSSESISKIEEDFGSDTTTDMVIVSHEVEGTTNDSGYAFILVDGQKFPIPKKYLRSDYLDVAEEAPSPKKTHSNVESNPSSEIKEQQPSNTPEVCQSEPLITLDSLTESQRHPLHIDSIGDINEPQISKSEITKESVASVSPVTSIRHGFTGNANGEQPNCVSYLQNDVNTYQFISSTSNFSDLEGNNSRLFIFPQNCPGFEVVYPTQMYVDANQGTAPYSWRNSHTQYAFANSNSAGVRCEFYDKVANTENVQSDGINQYTTDPFDRPSTQFIPNYQQTPPELRTFNAEAAASVVSQQQTDMQSFCATTNTNPIYTNPNDSRSESRSQRPVEHSPGHILPLVTGAVNVASSAINTARSVINMIVPKPEPGRWVNGHWIANNTESLREANLRTLVEMGFWDRDLNATLLARYNDDIARVVTELIQ